MGEVLKETGSSNASPGPLAAAQHSSPKDMHPLIQRQMDLLGDALLSEQKAENAFAPEGENLNRGKLFRASKVAWKAYDDCTAQINAALQASPPSPAITGRGDEGEDSRSQPVSDALRATTESVEPAAAVRERVAQLLYEIEPWHESGEFVEGFQVSPGGAYSWDHARALHAEFDGSAEFAGPWSVVADAYSTADAVLALLRAAPASPSPGPTRHMKTIENLQDHSQSEEGA